ncbi:hypothetical protein D3C80_2111460 [compost metagenome]
MRYAHGIFTGDDALWSWVEDRHTKELKIRVEYRLRLGYSEPGQKGRFTVP